MFVYNTTLHKTTKKTPLELVFGAEGREPVDLIYPHRQRSESMGGFLEELGQVLREGRQQACAPRGAYQRRQKNT